MMQDGNDDSAMEFEEDADDTKEEKSSSRNSALSELKSEVAAVLESHDLGAQRSAKLSQDDFLLLLSLFNKAGFHFS